MKNSILFILLFLPGYTFSQINNPPFERLKAYSTKSDDYHIGFFFTVDTVLLSYPTAAVFGNEKQISQDHSSLNNENNYQTYNTFEVLGEMGFINKNQYLIHRDSTNRIFTNTSYQFTLAAKKWDTILFTRNYFNENWKIILSENYTSVNGVFKNTSSKFYIYDEQSRLTKDSNTKLIQNVLAPDMVSYHSYDQDNNVIMDSVTKYTNNIAKLEFANYYKYENAFLIERRYLPKTGITQVWDFYKDSTMYREFSYLIYVNHDVNPIYEHLEFYDAHGSMIEYIGINRNNNAQDTTSHSKGDFTYDNNFNVLSGIAKGQDQFGNWVPTEKREYAYNNENLKIENAYFYWDRKKSIWYNKSKSTYEYNSDSQIVWQKYYTSEDSVSWLNKNMTTYTYTDYGNPSQVLSYAWDTLINDYFPSFVTNYYWEKYFYDENIIDANDDLLTAVYPNPSDNIFNLLFDCETDGQAEINIFNAVGKKIFKKTISVKKQINSFKWDASAFPAGMYIISISNDSKEKNLKVMKNQ